MARANVQFSMKTGLEHLPENKREQLQAIVAAVRNEVPAVDMIILFGSYARGDWVEDHETLYFSDFDLMVVVEAPSLAQDAAVWQSVSDELRHIGGHIPITLVAHDIHELNQEIRTGQYFFADVLREGILGSAFEIVEAGQSKGRWYVIEDSKVESSGVENEIDDAARTGTGDGGEIDPESHGQNSRHSQVPHSLAELAVRGVGPQLRESVAQVRARAKAVEPARGLRRRRSRGRGQRAIRLPRMRSSSIVRWFERLS